MIKFLKTCICIHRRLLSTIKLYLVYKFVFGKIGNNTRIISPLKIDGYKEIFIGDDVIIEYKTWLAAVPINRGEKCSLEIGEGTVIGHFNHIYATESIVIGKYVLTADKVYISDNIHGYQDVNIPILKQPVIQRNTVIIGDGTWIGENVCIIGAKIGKNCVIGAGAIITKDIPDYCVVVGNPARIIKKYNQSTSAWEVVSQK